MQGLEAEVKCRDLNSADSLTLNQVDHSDPAGSFLQLLNHPGRIARQPTY
jgi:hypothetical protein